MCIHNYFMLHVNRDTKYIGEFIRIKERRLIPSWQIAECSPNTRARSLAECPPTTGLPSQDVRPPPPRAPSEAECLPHTGAPSNILIKERTQIPSWKIAECSPNIRAPSLAKCPPTTGLPCQDVTECPPLPRAPSEAECLHHTRAPSDLCGLFRIFLQDNDMTLEMQSIQIPVPFQNFHKCIGLHQATRTNAYIWLMFDMISNIFFISHAETIQNFYC